jgi:hypothetical protein
MLDKGRVVSLDGGSSHTVYTALSMLGPATCAGTEIINRPRRKFIFLVSSVNCEFLPAIVSYLRW